MMHDRKKHKEASIWKGKCNKVEKKGSEATGKKSESKACLKEENCGQGYGSENGGRL